MKIRALAVALMAVAAIGWAQDMAKLEADHSVNSHFVTPHTAWAKPYAQGRTRILFFCRGEGVEPREAIELRQRFDVDLEMVFWARVVDSADEGWHGGERGVQRMARLLTQKWDVFVFLAPDAPGVRKVSPDMLPLEQQFALLEAVSAGAGLVLIGTDDRRVLKGKSQFREPPAALCDVDGAVAFSILQGRGIRLSARPAIAYRPGWEVAYDEWAMRVGKAVLWAAGKEPKLGLTLQPTSQELPRPNLPGLAVNLRWQGVGKATAEVTLRREDGISIALPAKPLRGTEGSVGLEIPKVRAGKYHLDVIARDGERVAGFASAPHNVSSERQVQAVVLQADWAEIGETLAGTVTLSGPAASDESLMVSLFDRCGREIARQPVPATAAAPAFRFDVQPWFPMLLEVRATLVDGTGEVASAWQFARVVKRHRGRFNFVMWGPPAGTLAPWAAQALADSGVTVILDSGGYARNDTTPNACFAACELGWIPYTTHIGKACQPACWADETKVQAFVDAIVEKNIPTRRHGVFVYSLGDEIVVRGSCLSPQCLEAYRRYLREQYGDIAALNASWGSSYAGFDAVQLSKADGNDEAEALLAGNLPRWFDRQAFQSHNFCQLCERFGKGFRRIDPESRCGFEGAGTFGAADNLDGFVRSNTFWSPYPGTADEVVRSIAPRDFPRANWMGYTKDADSLLEKYWRMVTRGSDSVWWWTWQVMGRFHGWLAPTLDPYPAVQDLLRDTQIVRDGLGDLLLASTMQTDGIGILYSQPSGYAAKVQTSPTYGNYESSHTAFHSALRELGLNFLYFTDRQVRLGEVDLSKFKVIILPMTQALSVQEARAFRQFVQAGGTLIADVRPGIYDGHVKPLAVGQLDDVFGVKRIRFAEAQTVDGQVRLPGAPTLAAPVALDLPKIRVDPGIAAAGAQAAGQAGEAPLALVNSFGKGQAVLLNLAMATYPSLSAEATPEAAATVLQALLARGAVASALQLTDGRNRRLRDVEVTRWLNGPVQIVSIFRHQGTPESARVNLPQAMYVYDLKNHAALGRKQAFELAVTPCRAAFYALSPERLKPVDVKAEPAATPGSVGRVQVRSDLAAGRQAVKVQVRLPDGRRADWLDSVVVVDGQGTVVDVPVAFNDPPGKWTIEATDLYTGKTTTAGLRVR